MIIDAHHHFWKLDLPFDYEWLKEPQHTAICKDFLPSQLQELIQQSGVDKTVFVQTQHNVEENRWVLGLAEEHEFIAGVVGWVDLASEDCEKQLEEFKDHPKFVGVRHITQDEPDDDFIVRPEIVRGLEALQKHDLPFDLLFYVKHLKHAATLGQILPELKMVVDHLAKPLIKDQVTEGWLDDLRAAAEHPNIYCKLSGMITEADWEHWKPEHLRPFVEPALELFRPERCMFGTDWPVCELAGSYEQVHNALNEVVGSLSESERNSIFCETAKQFYQLQI